MSERERTRRGTVSGGVDRRRGDGTRRVKGEDKGVQLEGRTVRVRDRENS